MSLPITRHNATKMIQKYIDSSAYKSHHMMVKYKTSTPGQYEEYDVRSWVIDKDSLLEVLGIPKDMNTNPNITGVRVHLGESDESADLDFFGKTLVLIPLDKEGNEIIPPNQMDIIGIEYHLPCPKNCGK